MKLNLSEEAVADFATSLVLQPLAETAYNAAIAHWIIDTIQKSARAIENFKTAIQNNPWFYEAVFDLATFLFISGNTEEARKQFENAAKLDPDAKNMIPVSSENYSTVMLVPLRGVLGPKGPAGPNR